MMILIFCKNSRRKDIGTAVAEFKTLLYAYMGIMTAISVLGITLKDKDPPTMHTAPPTHTPPAKKPKKPNHV